MKPLFVMQLLNIGKIKPNKTKKFLIFYQKLSSLFGNTFLSDVV